MPTMLDKQRPAKPWLAFALALMTAGLVILAAARPVLGQPLPNGLRLVMVDDPACAYCRKWLAEVGPYYASSRQGRRAPLVRRQAGDDSLKAFGRLVYTPTFLLVRDGRELDRIVGYGGAAEFWRQLQELLDKSDGGMPAQPEQPERTLPDDRETRLAPGTRGVRPARLPG